MRWPLVWSLLAALALAKDYYEILGVSRDAPEREIKKAYRSLSKKYHPDKNNGDEAASQKFMEVANAYEVLSNSEERSKYDRYGEDGLRGGNFHHQDPMDLFSHFFGGFGGGANGQQRVRKGPEVVISLPVSLQDVYKGAEIDFSVPVKTICEECDGSGSADGERHQCPQCQGSGQRVIQNQLAPGMFQRIQTICDKCSGRGSLVTKPCPMCKGERIVDDTRRHTIELVRGAPRQHTHVLEGEADQSPDWEAGNLVVKIIEGREGSMGYRRRGSNLFRDEVLSAAEAAAGNWNRELVRLDGETKFSIGRDSGAVIRNGHVEIVKGEGMPSETGHGDLYVRYVVVGEASSKINDNQPKNENGGKNKDEL